jgi:phosphatidyl-myo-inositol dimannoside synthase
VALRILLLVSDGFGSFGGIAKFNRDFVRALDDCTLVERVHVLPRLIPEPVREQIPEFVVYERFAARGKLAFVSRLLAHSWRGRGVDFVICGHIHLLPAAWLLARLRGARLALIIHGIEAWAPSRKHAANWLARRVDAIISVSKYSAERFTQWSKRSMDRAFILPNCVDLDRFRPQPRDARLVERYGLQSSKVILTVGRLASTERYKGFDQVIELLPHLAKRLPNIKYLIVGDGDDRNRLEEKVAAMAISNSVIFTGYIPESEKVAHYNLADVYVMPSRGEGFGIVLLEALACGVPVVGSRTDGSRETLLDGKLGHVVDPVDAHRLTKTITNILEHESSRQRIDAIETFSTEKFNERVKIWCRWQANEICKNPGDRFRPGPAIDLALGRDDA